MGPFDYSYGCGCLFVAKVGGTLCWLSEPNWSVTILVLVLNIGAVWDWTRGSYCCSGNPMYSTAHGCGGRVVVVVDGSGIGMLSGNKVSDVGFHHYITFGYNTL